LKCRKSRKSQYTPIYSRTVFRPYSINTSYFISCIHTIRTFILNTNCVAVRNTMETLLSQIKNSNHVLFNERTQSRSMFIQKCRQYVKTVADTSYQLQYGENCTKLHRTAQNCTELYVRDFLAESGRWTTSISNCIRLHARLTIIIIVSSDYYIICQDNWLDPALIVG